MARLRTNISFPANKPPELAVCAPSPVRQIRTFLRNKTPVSALRGAGSAGGTIVVDTNYFRRQAATLLRLAKSTSDLQRAAAVIEKAADFQSQVDDTTLPPDKSPRAPDVFAASRVGRLS